MYLSKLKLIIETPISKIQKLYLRGLDMFKKIFNEQFSTPSSLQEKS